MTARERQERAAICRVARERYLPFVKLTFPRYDVNPVARLVAGELEAFMRQVEAGESPRLILELPPRVGKSELVSRRYPGWLLGHHPEWYIGLVSYGADLAERLSRDARRVVMSEVYGEVFTRYETEAEWASERVEIDPASKSVSEWNIKPTKEVPQPGGMIAVGTRGTLTGKGFNVLLIDDPIKDQDEADSAAAKNRLWSMYVSTLHDRVEPGGGIIIIQQRWAADDLIGRVLDAQNADENDPEADTSLIERWRRVTLPAQAEAGRDDPLGRKPGEWLPARRTAEQWERDKAFYIKRSPRVWDAKFQQRPVAIEGAFFRPWEWLRFEEDDPDNEGPVFVFGDTSYAKKRTSDFNAFQAWRFENRPSTVLVNGHVHRVERTFRLLEYYKKRSPFPELKRDVLDMCFRHGLIVSENGAPWGRPKVYIEDNKAGTSLIQEFMVPVQHPQYGRVRIPVAPWSPRGDQDKDARVHAVTDVLARHEVAFPARAPWLQEFLVNMVNYQGEGTVEHDDDIDALTMALILMGVQEPAGRRDLKLIPFRFVAA